MSIQYFRWRKFFNRWRKCFLKIWFLNYIIYQNYQHSMAFLQRGYRHCRNRWSKADSTQQCRRQWDQVDRRLVVDMHQSQKWQHLVAYVNFYYIRSPGIATMVTSTFYSVWPFSVTVFARPARARNRAQFRMSKRGKNKYLRTFTMLEWPQRQQTKNQRESVLFLKWKRRGREKRLERESGTNL